MPEETVIMRAEKSKLSLHSVRTLNNTPIGIWNAEQKIYSGLGNSIYILT